MLLVAVSGTVFAADGTFDMEVSPHVLNIESNSIYVHIHTNIAYADATVKALEVNETEIVGDIETFPDDCGNLVVKFEIEEVKAIVIPNEPAVFVLTCDYEGGECIGEDSVPVIRVIPQKP
ncbi:hypothetical protein ACFLXU_06535 [Chloroflexota bacterium]